MLAFSVPVPTDRGIVVAITILVGLTALVVDAVGVTLRAPALAGLGLLTAYLISATNSGDGLSWRYFVLPVACWLALLAMQGIGSVRRWGTAVPRSGDGEGPDPVLGVAGTARLLGLSALALAVVLPVAGPAPADDLPRRRARAGRRLARRRHPEPQHDRWTCGARSRASRRPR